MQQNSKFVWEQYKHHLVCLVENYECVKAMNTMYTFKPHMFVYGKLCTIKYFRLKEAINFNARLPTFPYAP